MDPLQFQVSLDGGAPPPGAGSLLAALRLEAKGDWAGAHKIVQAGDGPTAAAVHAYLHRKEGDLSNADYWYERAGSTRPDCPLQVEWQSLVDSLLGQADA